MPTFDQHWATSPKGAAFWDRHPDGQDVREAARAAAAAVSGIASASQIVPDHGPAAGGTVVSIFGDGLTGATGLTFGGDAGTAFAVVNDNEVKATTPVHAAGAVDVVVLHPGGNYTLTDGFTYE